jgi:threonine aldolase
MMTRFIDLRSDTITLPTPAMRQAMAEAPVGDDVFGEDPTIRLLEQETAEMLGKPAALFMPSGTMANQVALRTHTEPGDEVVMHADSHIYFYECGAPAALCGVMCRLLAGRRGMFTADELRAALPPDDVHFPRTKLVCVENTHNRGGGSVWPIGQVAEVAQAARQAGLKLHMDGARLWNASVATGIPESRYASHFDSVSVCFSKGLGAPVGSALVGEEDFIARARRFRKMFGGGMRQGGIIAAGALHALRNHRTRLADDHANARTLAEALAAMPGVELDPADVQTNIVFFRVKSMPAVELEAKLKDAGVLVLALGADRVRAVTSLMVDADGIAEAIAIFKDQMTSTK